MSSPEDHLSDDELLDDKAPPVQIKGLVSRFGDNVVHDNLDLTVRRGEVLGIGGVAVPGFTFRSSCMIQSFHMLVSHAFGLSSAARLRTL